MCSCSIEFQAILLKVNNYFAYILSIYLYQIAQVSRLV